MLKYPQRPSEDVVFRENFINEDYVGDNGGGINGTPTVDNGATLNGTTDYFDYVDGPDFNYDEPQSFSFTMNTVTVAALSGLISKSNGASTYRGYQIYLEGGDIIFRIYYNGVTTGIKVQTDLAYNDGVDHDIVVAYNGSGLATGVDMYVDGEAVATTIQHDAGFGGDTTNDAVYIIGQTAYGSLPFDGVLKNVSQFKKALTPEEVLDIHQADTFREIDASKAVLWLPCRTSFDDGSNIVTRNMGTGVNAIMGDGSTTSLMPTQLHPHGYEFDNSDDYIDCGSDNIGTGEVTLGAMVYLNSYTETAPRFITNGNTRLAGNDSLDRFTFTSDGSTFATSNSGTLPTGKHVFVAVRRESDGTTTFYINGKEDTGTSNSGIPVSGTYNTLIGNDNISRCVDGSIDTPFIFPFLLTPTQIKELSDQAFRQLNI